MTEAEIQLRVILLDLAARLDQWATQSRTGGWSTHQVEPQRELAQQIRDAVASGRYANLIQYLNRS